MIRERLSNAQDKKGIHNTIKYVNRDKDCVLLDTNIPIAHIEKNDLNSYLSKYLFDFKDDFQTKIKNITQHDTVSYSKDDKITPAQAIEYARELYSKTHNIENRNYVMAVHNDTDNLHVHIVWSNLDKDGKSYKVSNDYRIIEKEIDEIENKYKLIKTANRKATQEKPNPLNFKKSKKSKNEKKLEDRGIKTVKEEIRELIDVCYFINDGNDAFNFLENLNNLNVEIILNGANGAYSIKFKNEIFKASDFGISKAKLFQKYGEDEFFVQKIKDLIKNQKKPEHQEIDNCSIFGNLFYDKIEKINKNKVINTKFKYIENSDKISFSFKSSDKTAFEYYKNENRMSFNNYSRISAKAGLQKWISMNEPAPILVTGNEEFKKNLWLEFQLMKLEDKGYSLKGYEPKKEDFELLEKIKADYKKIKENKEPDIKEDLIIDDNLKIKRNTNEEFEKVIQKKEEQPEIEKNKDIKEIEEPDEIDFEEDEPCQSKRKKFKI